MGIYNTFDYNDGTLYGDTTKVGYSAAPMVATAVGTLPAVVDVITGYNNLGEPIVVPTQTRYPKVTVSWQKPNGAIFGFRLVRNQDGYSEHEEDGQVLIDTYDPEVPDSDFWVDGVSSNPLIAGRYAYYTIWLLTQDYSWVIAARTWCLIPKEHGVISPDGTVLKSSAKKFVELFPKVYTTAMQSFLDEVDETSDFYQFFGGFSYTLDELLTYIDLLIPDASGRTTNPNMVPLQTSQWGLPPEPSLSIQRNKALARNALLINQSKGTLGGVNALATSLTGFATNVAPTPNLLLTIQDSSFYKGVGNWTIGSGGTLTSWLTTGSGDLPAQVEPLAVDKTYTGKVITSSNNVVMSLGAANPKLLSTPVSGGAEYEFSYYVKGTAVNVTPSIKWYDYTGTLIGSEVVGTAAAATGGWVQKTQTATAPSNAKFAVLALKFASAGTFYVDMVQLVDTSNLSGFGYTEGRGITVSLDPTKKNYVKNPSFESSGSSQWTWDGEDAIDWTSPSTLPGISLDESHMLTITTTDATDFLLSTTTEELPFSESYFTFSVYAKTETGVENLSFKLEAVQELVDESEVPYFETINDDNNEPVSVTVTPVGGVTDEWTRYSVVLYVPSTSAAYFLKASVFGEGAGNVLNFDSAQIERGVGATDYFDGSYVNRGGQWLSTANASESIIYRGKSQKIGRLVYELSNYLPLDVNYVILSGDNSAPVVETSGISS